MSLRVLSLLIWATVTVSAFYWGLRLLVKPIPVPGQALVASVAAPLGGDLSRLLGTPPAQPAAAAAPADSRFKLIGVVAPRAGQASGLALISVDGKPARALAVGREVEPGLRLLSVTQRQADLGTANGAAPLTLVLPMLAEASRGRPADMPGVPSQRPPLLRSPGDSTGVAMPRVSLPAEAPVDGAGPNPATR